MFSRIEGLLLIPHELLHISGYRLVGKQCRYRWGDNHVMPIGPLTRKERLVGLLFPFAACMVVSIFWLVLTGIIFFRAPIWALPFAFLFSVSFVYIGASLGDLRQAYRLLFDKPQDSKTPLDFLFFPVTDDQSNTIQVTSAVIVLVCLVLLFFTWK